MVTFHLIRDWDEKGSHFDSEKGSDSNGILVIFNGKIGFLPISPLNILNQNTIKIATRFWVKMGSFFIPVTNFIGDVTISTHVSIKSVSNNKNILFFAQKWAHS